jgi:hypothetical protein
MDGNISGLDAPYRVHRSPEGRRDGRSGAFEQEMHEQARGRKRGAGRRKPGEDDAPAPQHDGAAAPGEQSADTAGDVGGQVDLEV